MSDTDSLGLDYGISHDIRVQCIRQISPAYAYKSVLAIAGASLLVLY
jgi:hypothetical protein